jgi:N-acetylmuramoyl-L-alanine amidase
VSDVGGYAQTGFRLGDRGQPVTAIRSLLARVGLVQASDDDTFDESLDRAVRAFQQQRGLTVDGVVGPTTYRTLDEARWRLGDRLLTHLPGSLLCGDDVIALQQRLLELGFKVGRVDGRFGRRTELAVREFQRNVGIPPDGTCGPATLKALSRLSPRAAGGRPNAMRAEERIRRAGPQLTGKTVVLDPAVPRMPTPALQRQAVEIIEDLARRVEGRLSATGVQAFLSTPGRRPDDEHPAEGPAEAQRAEFANRTDAHLCISLRLDASESPEASGVSTYYYGSEAHDVHSSVGERFASLVQREIVARTDLTDLRSHPKTWDLLRLTRMPAACIDVGYLTNEKDAARLADPAFRDVLAEAVVVAVQRVYLAPDADAKTGLLRFSELREGVRRMRESQ